MGKKSFLIRSAIIFIVVSVIWVCSSCERFVEENGSLTDITESDSSKETAQDQENVSQNHFDPMKETELVLEAASVDFQGKNVIVTVSIENNPGISALQFQLQHSDELVLQSIQFDPRFGPYVTASEPYKNPQLITLLSPLQSMDGDGLFAVMMFHIKDHAQPKSEVYVRADIVSENTLTDDLNEVQIKAINCAIVLE